MKGRWKWVFLSIGVLLISATCGFGYQAKITRSQFEEAKDAFAKKDWDRVIDNLSSQRDIHVPPKESLRQFVHRYVEPILKDDKFTLVTRHWNSSMVPIPNEEMAYQVSAYNRPFPFIRLVYSDDVLWFDVPVAGRMYGVFQGKQVTLSFYLTFFRVAFDRYPPPQREDRWKSIVAFVKEEKEELTKMGLSPKNLYSKAKTWDEYVKLYEERTGRQLPPQSSLRPR